MNAEEQQREVDDLETRIERLRALYDQYFMGIEKIEPQVQRKDVDRRIWLLRKEQIRNTGVRFKFQTVIQRYNTFQQYWQRSVREIENGTFKRDVLRAAKRFGAKEALTLLGKKKAEQFAALAEKQEQDIAKRRALMGGNKIDEDELEALEDYDLDAEDFDEAPTPTSRQMDVPAGAAGQAHGGAAAYASRMELDFGPTPGVDASYDELDGDTGRLSDPGRWGDGGRASDPGRISAVPATVPSRPSVPMPESSPTPGGPRAPLRGWPLPPAGSSPGRLASPAIPPGGVARAMRPDAAPTPSDPEASRRRLAELAAQARRPQGGPPGEASPSRLDLEVGAPSAPRPHPLSAPTPYPASARAPSSGMPGTAPPRSAAPATVPPPNSPRPPASAPLPSQPRAHAPAPDSGGAGARPLVSNVARPVQAFAGLAGRSLSGARPVQPAAPPPSAPPSGDASRSAADNAAAAREAASAAREAAASRAAVDRDESLDEQRMRQVYAKYMDAKRQTNESTAGVTYERLAQSLKAQEAKLKTAHAGKRVDFEVVVKDGKATLKPIVR
jgi:hypothetical protein